MICLHAGRWQHTWTRTDDSTEGKLKIMFFSFDYVIKEMVNVTAVQPWSYASECIHNSMVAQLQRLPYTPYTYWEILTKKLCRKFCTQISSSQSEERTMVFTRVRKMIRSIRTWSHRGVWVSCQNSRLLLQLVAPLRLSTHSTRKVLLKEFFSLKK